MASRARVHPRLRPGATGADGEAGPSERSWSQAAPGPDGLSMRVAIVSPAPDDNSGGVQRFCHTLREVIERLGGASTVVGKDEVGRVAADLVITNGMLGARTRIPRIHVYHGCWVDHVRLGSRTAGYSLP